MIREAVAGHPPFASCGLRVFAKGSYANNTNVRADSDVDIAVECTDAEYWEEHVSNAHPAQGTYTGIWTPAKLRAELVAALSRKFGGEVDSTGQTAIQVHSNSARVDADVVPCFSYRYYFSNTSSRAGTKLFRTTGESVVNYPQQQLENGRSKNQRTGHAYKKEVRILKRVENAMASAGQFKKLPSYFIECLVFNCPDSLFSGSTWVSITRGILSHISNSLRGPEPTEGRWVEANDCMYLFHDKQSWARADGREFAEAALRYLG
jgi:hypothetical protein